MFIDECLLGDARWLNIQRIGTWMKLRSIGSMHCLIRDTGLASVAHISHVTHVHEKWWICGEHRWDRRAITPIAKHRSAQPAAD